MPSAPWQKSRETVNAGETARATKADQQFADQVGQAFSLPGLLPQAAKLAKRKAAQKGSVLIEFALCVGLFWIPLFFGLCQFGFRLIQALEVTQVCRDAGHMWAYGIDFSSSSNEYLLASLAPILKIDPTAAGGTSVVILSRVNYIGLADCQAGGYASTCPNYQQIVFTNQEVVGKTSLHASSYGTPATNAAGQVAQGSPSTSGYLNQASAVVSGFPNISLATGSTGQQYAYIAEVYSQASGLNWLFAGSSWVTSVSFF